MQTATFYSEISEAPENGMIHWINTQDGVRIRAAFWMSKKSKNGTIFLLPGRTGYIERYGRIITRLAELGFASAVVDWRGHGLSDRLTEDPNSCHIDNYSNYQHDLAATFQSAEELNLPKPWYIIGNSMGACIGLRALTEGLDVAACAFIAPMWSINLTQVQRYLAWGISWTAQAMKKGHLYAPGYNGQNYVLKTMFENNTMTNDRDMYDYWKNQAESQPELLIGGPSMSWLFESLKECQSLSEISSPDIPCLTLCGNQDQDVDINAIKERMTKWPKGSFDLVQNAKHDLMSETTHIRENVIIKICDMFKVVGQQHFK